MVEGGETGRDRGKEKPMAAKKKASARVVRKTAPKSRARTAAPAAAKPSSRPIQPRRTPETLRLTKFTPSLTVNDLATSLHFYTDALGFFPGQRWHGEDGLLHGVMLKAGAMEIGISQDDWKLGRDRKKGAGFRIFCETTQDVDALAARVKATGYALAQEPSDDRDWGARSFSVDDPDGYHLTITKRL
jgi:uncharacterized glyoxalase superfamily protein PhnB